jgi:hypothetical protein
VSARARWVSAQARGRGQAPEQERAPAPTGEAPEAVAVEEAVEEAVAAEAEAG